MARRRGSVGMFLVKWLVIPVGLAALGFFVAGPIIARQLAPPPLEPRKPEPTVEEPTRPRVNGNPDVEVSARPAARRRPSRRRTQPRTEERQPVPEVPSPDLEPARTGPDGG